MFSFVKKMTVRIFVGKKNNRRKNSLFFADFLCSDKVGMKREVSYIAQRQSKTNYQYLKSYDKDEPSKYIVYLDASTLYGSTLQQVD